VTSFSVCTTTSIGSQCTVAREARGKQSGLRSAPRGASGF
jgi:hypothetical protein